MKFGWLTRMRCTPIFCASVNRMSISLAGRWPPVRIASWSLICSRMSKTAGFTAPSSVRIEIGCGLRGDGGVGEGAALLQVVDVRVRGDRGEPDDLAAEVERE